MYPRPLKLIFPKYTLRESLQKNSNDWTPWNFFSVDCDFLCGGVKNVSCVRRFFFFLFFGTAHRLFYLFKRGDKCGDHFELFISLVADN